MHEQQGRNLKIQVATDYLLRYFGDKATYCIAEKKESTTQVILKQ